MNRQKTLALGVFSMLTCAYAPELRAQSTEAKTCPPVDIVFTMDTSGSMNDESQALCDTISKVTEQLADKNIQASAVLWGITRTGGGGFSCLASDVVREIGAEVPGDNGSCGPSLGAGSTGNTEESWGPATAIVAERFPWSEDSIRVVVPISDEGPCGGNPCSVPGQDAESIQNAINLAKNNQVFVSPIVGTGASQCVTDLATEVANKTGGKVFSSQDPNLDIADAVTALVEDACKTALACELTAEQRIYIPGSDSRLKVAFSEGDAPAPGRDVRIEVLEGPNASSQANAQTQSDGSVRLGYTSDGTRGVDRVQATCVDSSGREQKSVNTELIFWDTDCDGNGIADQCDLSCDNFDGLCQEITDCGQGVDADNDGRLDACAVQNNDCGNGVVDCDEECDDGNNVSGDGCSATCEIEPDPGDDCEDDLGDALADWIRSWQRLLPWLFGRGCCG